MIQLRDQLSLSMRFDIKILNQVSHQQKRMIDDPSVRIIR